MGKQVSALSGVAGMWPLVCSLLTYVSAVLAVGSLSGQLKLFLITTRQNSGNDTEQTIDHDTPVMKKRRKAKVGTPHQGSCAKDHEETITEDPGEEDREETTGLPHKDTSSQFSVTEVCPLWCESDKLTITHLCWSTEVSVEY